MSEAREECYRCINNRNCFYGAEYGSMYCKNTIKYKTSGEDDDSLYAIKFATMQKQIEEKEKRIAELEEENTEMKNLFRIQASIAKELEFEERDKIIKFRNAFYAPDTMQVTDDIEKGKRIDLSYVDITKLLEKTKGEKMICI